MLDDRVNCILVTMFTLGCVVLVILEMICHHGQSIEIDPWELADCKGKDMQVLLWDRSTTNLSIYYNKYMAMTMNSLD